MHCRLRPVRNTFRYPVTYFLFDLDELSELDRCLPLFGYNRWRFLSLHDSDYGRPPVAGLHEGLQRYLRGCGITDPPHRIELLTQARTLSYVFNPVSYFYGYGPSDELQWIVAEVNNTFGDRIRYLLGPEKELPSRQGRLYRQPKAMHVSPFMPMPLEYLWRFDRRGDRLSVEVDETENGHRFFKARLTGRLEPICLRSLLRALWRFPLMPVQIITLIHWQALRLYLKKAPFFPRPPFVEDWAGTTRWTDSRPSQSRPSTVSQSWA